jgi:beta propeller repeat protein
MFVASAVVVAKKPPKPPPEEELGTEYQITFSEDGRSEWRPEIYGNIIVWESWQNDISDIYMYDLGADGIPYTDDDGGETCITNDPTSSQQRPGIWENRIVYDSNENGRTDVYLYDITTGVTTQITTDPNGQFNPKICGDIIAYVDNRNDNPDIYAYNLGTQTEMQITTDPAPQRHPYVFGDIIAWTDFRSGYADVGMDIYMYKFSTGQEYAITNDEITQNWQYIRDNKIVWMDERNVGQAKKDNKDIYMYDLGPDGIPFTGDTGEGEYRLTGGDGISESMPRLDGDLAIFEGNNNRGNNIYIKNIVSSDTDQITKSNSATRPFIFEDHLVYVDGRDGNNDIYLFILNP